MREYNRINDVIFEHVGNNTEIVCMATYLQGGLCPIYAKEYWKVNGKKCAQATYDRVKLYCEKKVKKYGEIQYH